MESLQVQEIQQVDQRTLGITWTSGAQQQWDVVMLRRQCPCASCVDEWSRKPILKPEDVSDEVRPVSIRSVGRYALAIDFSDGHNTGIYSFGYLSGLS